MPSKNAARKYYVKYKNQIPAPPFLPNSLPFPPMPPRLFPAQSWRQSILAFTMQYTESHARGYMGFGHLSPQQQPVSLLPIRTSPRCQHSRRRLSSATFLPSLKYMHLPTPYLEPKNIKPAQNPVAEQISISQASSRGCWDELYCERQL